MEKIWVVQSKGKRGKELNLVRSLSAQCEKIERKSEERKAKNEKVEDNAPVNALVGLCPCVPEAVSK
jgi:hypothetical protein